MRDFNIVGINMDAGGGGYAVELYEQWARRRQIEPKEFDRARDSLRMAAMLHDVGKVAISDLILKKPGRHRLQLPLEESY